MAPAEQARAAPRQGRKHHYRYDPPKAQFYVATTLSWLGERYVVIRPRS
jgi:hypothetical protein